MRSDIPGPAIKLIQGCQPAGNRVVGPEEALKTVSHDNFHDQGDAK
jgi:hypothetical protein